MEGKKAAVEPENGALAQRQAHDERERAADEREQTADERDRLGEAVETLEQRMLETIERSRALLALNGERLNRQEAAVMRAEARRERHQAEIDRASAESERGKAAVLPDPGKAIERAKALHKRARTVMEALACNEDEIAASMSS
jgi:hypothetical protein